MANLDVSDVLNDPDFHSPFQVARMTYTVNNGRTVGIEELLDFMGVVQPMNNKDLKRLSSGDFIKGGIVAWCKQKLTTQEDAEGLNDGTAPDEIIYNDNRYIVVQCNPWKYGKGYYRVGALIVLGPTGYEDVRRVVDVVDGP